jgi:beta-N-acetylhexosaminidase
MVSSVIAPALCRKPAMLCPQTYARLRKMGFKGAIVTDSLDADALRPYGSVGAVAVKALAAGADSVLVTSPWSTLQVIRAISSATKSGRLDPSRLDASAKRLRALR